VRVCVVGSGGREHALADVLGRSAEVVVTPGNPGIPGSTDAPPDEVEADLYVIGPEVPLVEGLADRLRAQNRRVFGPGADGARLEGSKAWMKDLLARAGVPTARHEAFIEPDAAIRHLRTLAPPYVVKTDGLAAGKGVLVTESLDAAAADVRAKLAGTAFGIAGHTVVIEEGMFGPELSLLAVCDGQRAVPLAPAQDFKRVGDGDTGPNTGGMGAYSPVPLAPPEVVDQVMDLAVEPTLAALRGEGIDYRGVLYAGLMLTPDGPRVLEFNVRFGDPEAQVVLPLLEDDLADLLAGAADGSVGDAPGFAADGALVTAGGRVLSITGRGPTLADARAAAYAAVGDVSWPGAHHRDDIAAAAAGGA
jgi:phosphoribosylamine---glycine ligase